MGRGTTSFRSLTRCYQSIKVRCSGLDPLITTQRAASVNNRPLDTRVRLPNESGLRRRHGQWFGQVPILSHTMQGSSVGPLGVQWARQRHAIHCCSVASLGYPVIIKDWDRPQDSLSWLLPSRPHAAPWEKGQSKLAWPDALSENSRKWLIQDLIV